MLKFKSPMIWNTFLYENILIRIPIKIGPKTFPKFLKEPIIPITVPILLTFVCNDTRAIEDGSTVASAIPIKIAGINNVEVFSVNDTKNIDILSKIRPKIILG